MASALYTESDRPASTASDMAVDSAFGRIAPESPAYLTPPAEKCPLLDVPEEVLVKVYAKLEYGDLLRCLSVCKQVHAHITETPSIALKLLLEASHLRLNPNALLPVPNKPLLLPPSPAQLLETLRERLDRMSSFDPRKKTLIRLMEKDGRLYEYLEGILLRGASGPIHQLPMEMAVYDIRKLGDWEDEVEEDNQRDAVDSEERTGESKPKYDRQTHDWTQSAEDGDATVTETVEVVEEKELAETLRATKRFGFEIAEFAVDPGQDLLVVVQIVSLSPSQHHMLFHLKSLSTFEPHPRAPREPLKWPVDLPRRKVELGFQICDDGLYVLRHNQRLGATDRICGWQWTTGRLAVTITALPIMSFESFVMLTPSSFMVPIVHTRLDTMSGRNDVLNDISDLSWTHHLNIYAFPPLSSTPVSDDPSEPHTPPHTATLVRTLDMPLFDIDLTDERPPPRMAIRADPPPRTEFPTHPVENVQPFVPQPTSGTIIIEFACQTQAMPFPHYVLAVPRKTLLRYIPPRDSLLLRQARPGPAGVVSWDTLRPDVRLFGPDMIPASWVCYVYQDRYITPMRPDLSQSPPTAMTEDELDDYDRDIGAMRLFDFDPSRVKRELLKRAYADPAYISPTTNEHGKTVSMNGTGSPMNTSADAIASSRSESAGNPSSPSRTRQFIRRLSSTFKRSRLHSPDAEEENDSRKERVATAHKYDGEQGGVTLVTAETVLPPTVLLQAETRTGANFPYMYVEKDYCNQRIALLDDERIIFVHADDQDPEDDRERDATVMEVLEF